MSEPGWAMNLLGRLMRHSTRLDRLRLSYSRRWVSWKCRNSKITSDVLNHEQEQINSRSSYAASDPTISLMMCALTFLPNCDRLILSARQLKSLRSDVPNLSGMGKKNLYNANCGACDILMAAAGSACRRVALPYVQVTHTHSLVTSCHSTSAILGPSCQSGAGVGVGPQNTSTSSGNS